MQQNAVYRPAQLSAIALMVGSSFLMASMGLGVRLASAHYSVGEVAFYRGALGALLILALARAAGIPVRTKHVREQFHRSLAGAVATTCFFYGLAHLPLGTAITLNYTSSLWIAALVASGLVASAVPGERGDRRLLVAAVVGFGGVALVLRPTVEQGLLLAAGIGLCGGMLSGIAHLQVATLGRLGEPAVRTVFYYSIGNMVAGAVVMVAEGRPTGHTLQGVALLSGLTLCATGAQWMLTRAYATGSAMVNASLQYLSIAWAFAYGVLLFAEPVHAAPVIGIAAIVAAGMGASIARTRRRA